MTHWLPSNYLAFLATNTPFFLSRWSNIWLCCSKANPSACQNCAATDRLTEAWLAVVRSQRPILLQTFLRIRSLITFLTAGFKRTLSGISGMTIQSPSPWVFWLAGLRLLQNTPIAVWLMNYLTHNCLIACLSVWNQNVAVMNGRNN